MRSPAHSTIEIDAPPPETNRSGTRERLMLATERLVAEHGVAGVSVRDIAREAGTQLSAIDYHFKSKIGLVLATLEWRGRQGGAMRERQIAPYEALERIDDARGLLHALLEAHVNRPSSPGQPTQMFFIRLLVDPTPEVVELFRQASIWFRQDVFLLMRVRPALSFEDACWRYYAMMGLTHLSKFDDQRLSAWSDGRCDPSTGTLKFDLMVDYALAILDLPPDPRVPSTGRVPETLAPR
jgi:AcrR family transcriptional regulator